jgi:GMP synthase-like glutamine amidotransferase
VDAATYAAVAVLGGAMSVNDELPWLRRAEQLLSSAVALNRPVLGHCLGGQLLARALGARVCDNPVPEIGWTWIQVADHALARAWLGEAPELPVYQWHEQTFALPPGATLLAGNTACAHQAFALGPHLGMQFHIEVDGEKLSRWFADAPSAGDPRLALPSVQAAAAMQADTERHMVSSQCTAARVYAWWWAQAQAPQNGELNMPLAMLVSRITAP